MERNTRLGKLIYSKKDHSTLKDNHVNVKMLLFFVNLKLRIHFHLTENLEKTRNQQKLLIFHIGTSIDNMYRYVKSRKVLLPEDKLCITRNEDIKEETVDFKLDRIQAHIEDLINIRDRVSHAQLEENYSGALLSKGTQPC